MSFVGGGTDLPAFYTRESGAVISMTINKYVYITVNRRFDQSLRISYSQTEIVDNVSDVQHPLFREIMKDTSVDSGVEVTSIADVPAGTGLGSSSSFAVGLFHALHAFRGRFQTPTELAEQACRLELEILKEPIGKQDQYAAAFGGLRRYVFNTDHSVFVDPVICPPEIRDRFFSHLMLFAGGEDGSTIVEIVREHRRVEVVQERPEHQHAIGVLDEAGHLGAAHRRLVDAGVERMVFGNDGLAQKQRGHRDLVGLGQPQQQVFQPEATDLDAGDDDGLLAAAEHVGRLGHSLGQGPRLALRLHDARGVWIERHLGDEVARQLDVDRSL